MEACMKKAFALSMKEGSRWGLTQEELCSFTWSFRFRDLGPGGWFPNTIFKRYFHPDSYVDTRPVTHFWTEARMWRLFLGEDDGDQYVQINEYPPMSISRQLDWSWTLESMWVFMASDHKAGPNPGRDALCEPSIDSDS
ncbi:hypothetical protein CEUSTIGMA_g3886.t1 [Chlamydomonas eustigma]|uniref:Uncharacterized protein n=1 Tax=Chlamydomonas eustigma TaxID=1157962 RepID=A0A250X039_9CHLO|nr:hypothetical protein CEUSTIGMA_g3886.t1 [Chlamydomonas eustigma]|eukprot:GAX76441.1 hypothetical protein CEUSTIGMA_g3886.t1 [Chlamydomonas eustigma]